MLEVSDLCVQYDEVSVLKRIQLVVRPSEFVAVIGSNGAGKSTLCGAIFGLMKVEAGIIRFLGNEIQGRPTYEIARMGLGYVPEGRRLFGDMTVVENLRIAYRKNPASDGTANHMVDRMLNLFPELKDHLKQMASTLSGGQQQMVALARAMMSNPKMLVVDELSLGLSPIAAKKMFTHLQVLRKDGVGLLLVEQNVRQALRLTDRAYILSHGKIDLDGKSADLLCNPEIEKSYFGTT